MGIVIENVSKRYGKVQALNNVSLSLKKGEVVGLLGPNGAGKSTLMKILTGYYTQWEGKVSFFEKDLKKELHQIQKEIGYLSEQNPLYNDMRVIEYLHFVAELYQMKSPPVAEVLTQTGLSERQTDTIKILSKGYKQRLGIAAAILHNPKVIILDEPTTGLDPNQLIEIRKLIRHLAKEKTVLLSTHILQEVEALCDRIVIINYGKIVLDKPINELQKNEENIIEVSFDYRVETEALCQISHVKKVINIHEFDYELYIKGTQDIRPAIFDFAYDNGLKILNLQIKNKGLETLFQELTNQNT